MTTRYAMLAACGAMLLPAPLAAQETATPLNQAAEFASCLIEANRVIKLSSEVQGTLAEVLVKRGDRVQKGQIVARLDSQVEAAQVESLRLKASNNAYVQSKLAVATTMQDTLTRQRGLGKRGITSQQQIEKTEIDYVLAAADAAQAELEQQLAQIDLKRAEAAMTRRVLRAPVEGVVTQVALDAGEYADPDAMAMEIAETSVLRVEVYLPLSVYPLVRLGMTARIEPQEPIGGQFPVTITSKDGQIDSASGLFQVQFEMANPDGSVPAGIRCVARFDAQ